MARRLSDEKEGLVLLEVIDTLDLFSEKSLKLIKKKIEKKLGTGIEDKEQLLFLTFIIEELKSIGIIFGDGKVYYDLSRYNVDKSIFEAAYNKLIDTSKEFSIKNKTLYYSFIRFVIHLTIKYISNNYINSNFVATINELIKNGLENNIIDKETAKKLRTKLRYFNSRSLSINNICHVIAEELYYVFDYSFPGYANSEFFIKAALKRFNNK